MPPMVNCTDCSLEFQRRCAPQTLRDTFIQMMSWMTARKSLPRHLMDSATTENVNKCLLVSSKSAMGCLCWCREIETSANVVDAVFTVRSCAEVWSPRRLFQSWKIGPLSRLDEPAVCSPVGPCQLVTHGCLWLPMVVLTGIRRAYAKWSDNRKPLYDDHEAGWLTMPSGKSITVMEMVNGRTMEYDDLSVQKAPLMLVKSPVSSM